MRTTLWLASAGAVLAIAVAATTLLREPAPGPLPPAAAVANPPSAAAIAKPAAIPPPTVAASRPMPSFDIVTIDPHGQAVIAGRAAPGDRVQVLDGDHLVGEVTADNRGEWVLVPEMPMPPGNRQLALAAVGPDGGPARHSADVVALSVTPPADRPGGGNVAVLLPGDGAPARVLQGATPPSPANPLSLDAAEYGAADRLALSGHAMPGAHLNVYAGERLLGRATADAAGKWSLSAAYPQPAAGSELRLEELAADGSVGRHWAAPFAPPPAAAAADTYVVERGNSLWLIARRTYGQGMRYVAIYRANQDLIRDPNRIYPGQQFKLPKS